MTPVYWSRLGLLREMAKWMESVPTVVEKDVNDIDVVRRSTSRRYFLQVKEEIAQGRLERREYLGN